MKLLYILLISSGITLLASCVDLDIYPASSIVKENFYETEEDAVTAVNGVYAALTQWDVQSLYGNLILYMVDLTSDYVKAGDNTNMMAIRSFSTAQYDTGNELIELAWEQTYAGINRANIVIDKLPEATFSEDTKARLINEAKFLRALFYFNAVRLWGEVPLILHDGEGIGATREEVDVVYAQIVQDLEDATALPASYSGSEAGRATSGAARGLLAKVYLTWAQTSGDNQTGKYDKSIEYANSVTGYELVETFTDLWDVDKKNGPEHIFSVGHGENQTYRNTTGHCVFATGFSNLEPVLLLNDLDHYEAFDDRDQRKAGSYAKTLYNPATGEDFLFTIPRFRKYIDTLHLATETLGGRNIDVAYLRYAEILLLKAEAINERYGNPNAEAYEAINQVRRRAFKQFPVTQPSAFDLSGLTYEQFRDSLRHERYLEFVLEYHRWFDLVRWKTLLTTVQPYKPAITARNYRFPIPYNQRQINPGGLWQNWGYDESIVTGNPYAGYE